MKIAYFCHWDKLTGFGRAARDYVAALVERFGHVTVVPFVGAGNAPSPEPEYERLNKFVDSHASGHHDVAIVHGPALEVANFEREKRGVTATCWLAMTTWEVEGDAQEVVRGTIYPRYDGVIFPSRFSREGALVGTGFTPNAWVVPHTIDLDAFLPGPENINTRPSYSFYTIGAPSDRKNYLGVVKAFIHAFCRTSRDVELTLVGPTDDGDLKNVIAASGLKPEWLPPIRFLPSGLTQGEIANLHANNDCFVTATRGEAFHLGAFEAHVTGNPVIATDFGGHTEYLDMVECGGKDRLVSFHKTPVIPNPRSERDPATGSRRLVADAPAYLDARNLWAEPNLEQFAAMMQWMEEKRPTTPGLQAHEAFLRRHYSYKAVAHSLDEVFRNALAGKER